MDIKHADLYDKMIDELYSLQENGVYKDFKLKVGTATEWVTGYVLGVLLHKVNTRDTEEFLINSSRIKGGWGFNKNVVADADSTAVVIKGVGIENVSSVDIDFLMDHIKNSGGVSTYNEKDILLAFNENNKYFPKAPLDIYKGWLQEHHSTTCNTLIALKSVLSPSVIQQMELYIINNFSNGIWRDHWWHDWYYPTMISVLALEGNIPDSYKRKTLKYIDERQLSGGGWGENGFEHFATSCVIVILRMLGYDQSKMFNDAFLRLRRNYNHIQEIKGTARMQVPAADELYPSNNSPVDDNGVFALATILSSLRDKWI